MRSTHCGFHPDATGAWWSGRPHKSERDLGRAMRLWNSGGNREGLAFWASSILLVCGTSSRQLWATKSSQDLPMVRLTGTEWNVPRTIPGCITTLTSRQPFYDRPPSDELRNLLLPGGFLEYLPGLNRRLVAGVELDVHLRIHDEVQVYCGLTRLADIRRASDGTVVVSAHPAYRRQDCGTKLFGRWNPDRPGEFNLALDVYLDNVAVGRRNIAAEGAVQCLWSSVTEPWICFDREAVLAYPSSGPLLGPDASCQLASAKTELRSLAGWEGWRYSPGRKWWSASTSYPWPSSIA